MTRSNRGAARVSVVWMISVLVLFFVALAFGFVATSDSKAAEDRATAAAAERETAVAQFQTEADQVRALSSAVGWYDAASADRRTNLEAMAGSLESAKDVFSVADTSAKTVEQLLPLFIAAHKRVQDELAQKRTDLARLDSERQQAQKTLEDVVRKKDQELADLRQQVADEAAKYTANSVQLTKTLADTQNQVRDLAAQKNELQRESDDVLKRAEREKAALRSRNDVLVNELKIVKQPDTPDGSVLAVSESQPMAVIDLGANDRLPRGTRFRIVAPGPKGATKGWAEVTRLLPDMAEVTLTGVDRFNPVVAGDLILNPVFARGGQRHAVLAGRFSSPTEPELRALLAHLDIAVQDDLDERTDYLILGSAVYTDEDGEPLEEPLQPTELEVYRAAEGRSGIAIVPVSDLRGYFVF